MAPDRSLLAWRGWSAKALQPACLGLLLAGSMLTACAPGGKEAEVGVPTPTNLSTLTTTQLEWGPCPDDYFVKHPAGSFEPDEVDCSMLLVPAVYGSESDLPDFAIAMMRLPATGKRGSKGTLFTNPGGPGASGIETVQQQPFPARVRSAYDIVGFDPRGVLHSQPISGDPIRCSDELDFASYWEWELTPANLQEAEELQESFDDFQRDCEGRNPAWWTLGTSSVVHDLEEMRRAVTNRSDLNFLGSSYGTTIGAEYLRTYPHHVGHLVLDSPTGDSWETDAQQLVEVRATEEQVLRLVDGYAEAKGLTPTEVRGKLLQIRQWGENDQLAGFVGLEPFPGDPRLRLSSEYAFVHGLLALTYRDTDRVQKTFNQGLDALIKHRWNGLFEYLSFDRDGYDVQQMLRNLKNGEPYDPQAFARDNSLEIRAMVNGLDVDLRELDSHAEIDALDHRFQHAAPFLWRLQTGDPEFRYYPEHPGNDWSWAAFDSPLIPDPPPHRPTWTNESGTPVMIIGSKDESTTPYQVAVTSAEQLDSPLITWLGNEHAPLARFRHECLNDLFVDYLLHDTLPAQQVTCQDNR